MSIYCISISPNFTNSRTENFPQLITEEEDEEEGEEFSLSREIAAMSSDDDCQCRPLGFLLGLPFALISLILSLIGIIIWIVGITLSCLCPCCLCVTVIVELALGLIKAPFHVMRWFTKKIPC